MRVGTRASALALAQANWVLARLAAGPLEAGEPELVKLSTIGDRGLQLRDKARWTSEIEAALLEARIDLAVHSAKDVPGTLGDGTVIAAVPVREDPVDVLCGAPSLASLPVGARIGTSSLRRAAQLRALREDLEIVELRGNVDTRLRKLANGEADAIVLAAAGLRRLGRDGEAGCALDELVPAPGQGALLLQARVGDQRTAAAVAALDDPGARACVLAERAFARALGASCNTPLGAAARFVPARPGVIELRVWVGLPDGSEWIADQLLGDPDTVGTELAYRMIGVGARELLARAEALA